MLKRYCAWHKKYFGKELSIGQAPAEPDGVTRSSSPTGINSASYCEVIPQGATHGICDDCRKLVEKEITVSARGGPAFGGMFVEGQAGWSSTCPRCGNHKLLNRNYCFKCEKAILSVEIPLLIAGEVEFVEQSDPRR